MNNQPQKKSLMPENIRFAALAADIVCFRIINKTLHVLLGQVVSVNNQYKGWWAHIGGLVKAEETADEAVERLLRDKAGINKIFKEQLYTFSKVDRDPRGRVVSVAYLALTCNDEDASAYKGEVETVWRPVATLPKLAYDHNEMTTYALERLQSKIKYTNIIQYLLPREFTLSELQQAYEIVLGEGLDKRNFRKKVLASGMIVDTEQVRKKGAMRPAAIYRFASLKQESLDIL
ncbi:MAG: NUDIX domain-containing protein [Patescibacteria group bacterium]